MSINLSVRRFTEKSTAETFSFQVVPVFLSETQDWFDSIRHTGDREFVEENEFQYIDDELNEEEKELARPKDFNKSREWIKANIVSGNQHRLLDAIDKMEADPNLCFHWSW